MAYTYDRTAAATGKSLDERIQEAYDTYTDDLAKELPAALEQAAKEVGVKLSSLRRQDKGDLVSFSFDGYRLTGGRGEKKPDLVGHVWVTRGSATTTNRIGYGGEVKGLGSSGGTDRGYIYGDLSPKSGAEFVGNLIGRLLDMT